MSVQLALHKSGEMMERRAKDALTVTDAPAIPGLVFRRFRGEVDYPGMVAVIQGSKEVDGLEWVTSVEDTARSYQHLVNCDPYRDMLFAELHGRVIGYSRMWWQEEIEGKRLYNQFIHLLPEWREAGIRRAMLRYNERLAREIAADHPAGVPRLLQAWCSETENHWESLLRSEHYRAVRYTLRMVRPDLDDIPALPLPDGLEVRPVQPAHYTLILEALNEAFRDHWGAREWSKEWLEEWKEDPTFNPALWQVAWDGDQIAGTVLNFINVRQNREYGRKRGYTEFISVRRPWRRQGLAKALIARSFKVLKEQGMTEAALSVDAENLCGALRLYEGMGFREVKRFTTYRKPLD